MITKSWAWLNVPSIIVLSKLKRPCRQIWCIPKWSIAWSPHDVNKWVQCRGEQTGAGLGWTNGCSAGVNKRVQGWGEQTGAGLGWTNGCSAGVNKLVQCRGEQTGAVLLLKLITSISDLLTNLAWQTLQRCCPPVPTVNSALDKT